MKFGEWLKRVMRRVSKMLGRRQEKKIYFEYLHPADRPVIDDLEKHELVWAKDQPQYIPLRTLTGRTEQREVISRWTLTPEQRKAVAEGADIFLELLTFGNPLQPIRIAVSDGPNPDYFRMALNLSESDHHA